MAEDADVIVVGGGLAGLVAACEITDAGKRVIVVDQEGEAIRPRLGEEITERTSPQFSQVCEAASDHVDIAHAPLCSIPLRILLLWINSLNPDVVNRSSIVRYKTQILNA